MKSEQQTVPASTNEHVSMPLPAQANSSIILGVDIGGSHITAALVDLETGEILKDSYRRDRVNAQGTKEEILLAWRKVIEEVQACSTAAGKKIGIAMPGPFDYQNGISLIQNNAKYDALYNLNVRTMLADELFLDTAAIRMKNDASCFLQGEVMAGAGKGFNDAIGLTLGTGIGTARYHNGVAEDADLWQAPFKDGMTEDYISTRWFISRFSELGGKRVGDVKELAALYETDPDAKHVFEEFAGNLAQFLVYFITMDNPGVVIIGGSIANASNLFFPQVVKHLADHDIHIPLRKAVLGEEAAIIGAAGCWKEATTIL